MASMANAFSLLQGAGENVASSASKKKKKAKAPTASAPSAPVSDAAASVSKPAAAAPASNGTSAKPAAATPKVVPVAEAIAILERAAREAKSAGEKAALWKDWIRQANDKSGKGFKYQDSDGSPLEFKQVLLRSKALEISIEGAVSSGMVVERQDSLATLLGTFLSGSLAGNGAVVLASALGRLAALLADEAPDTVGAAQRAVHNVVAALKTSSDDQAEADAGSQAGSWVSRVVELDKEIARQQGMLQKLAATSSGAMSKQQTSCAWTIYKLQEQKFDLLQPENLPSCKPSSGSSASRLRSLEDLKTVIGGHLRDATSHEESNKGKAASVESQRVQTLASYRREENILAQEAAEVSAQVRSLEAQLRALKSKQEEIEEKRAQLQQRQRVMLDSLGSKGGSGRGAQGVLSAAHYRDELAVVEGLQDFVDPSRKKGASAEQVLAVQAQQAGAASQYIAEGQRYLSMVLAALTDMPQRISFCKQRLLQAEKLSKLGVAVKGDHGKQKEDSEKLLKETLSGADDLLRNTLQVTSDLAQRFDAIARFAPEEAPAAQEQMRVVDNPGLQIRVQYENIQAANRAPAPQPEAPQQRGRPQSAAPAHAAVQQAAAAPAPVAVPAAPAPAPAAAPAPARPVSAPVAAPAEPKKAEPVSAPAPAPAAAPAPAPAPARPAAPARQWAKVTPSAPADVDNTLPTPAEAFKAAEPADGFKPAAAKKARKPKA